MRKNIPYILGLDLGISSAGWAVIEIDDSSQEISHKRLIDTGVRIFESVVDPKGNTNASIRRGFRSARRRIRRRAHRLARAKNCLLSHGLIKSEDELESAINLDSYYLRYKGLDKLLSDIELSKILLHLTKRRGFRSNRKNIEKDEGGSGEYGKSIQEFGEILSKYRTAGEALYLDKSYLNPAIVKDSTNLSEEILDSVKYNHQKRNRRDRFIALFTRAQIKQEIEVILNKQRNLGNSKVTDEFIEQFIDIWSSQRHFFDPAKINQLVGQCSIYSKSNGFDNFEYRAPSRSLSYNKLRSIQSLINFLGYDDKAGRFFVKTYHKDTSEFTKIFVDDVEALIHKVEEDYVNEFKDFNTNHLRQLLEMNSDLIIAGEKLKKDNDGKVKLNRKGEAQYEYKLIFKKEDYLNKLRKNFTDYYPELYSGLASDTELFDNIFVVNLARYREEEMLFEQVCNSLESNKIDFDKAQLSELVANLDTTDKYGDLSLKALNKIIPELRKGRYTSTIISEIKKEEGISETKNQDVLLPSFDDNTLTNPRVIRVISESRKVINALVKKYGSPTFIHVELGRDLKNSEDVKKRIDKYNNELEKRRVEVRDKISRNYNIANPSKRDIQRYMLWQDQGEKCMLSMEKISADRLFTDTEIDHAIPWSRCADDSYLNRILVSKKVNQQKGNRMPFEYFGSDVESDSWKRYVNFVNSLYIAGRKKAKLTSMQIEDGFSTRDLNDTRYASRYIKNYLENNLKFREFDRDSRVVTVNGGATAIIRSILTKGLSKTRGNDRHHALDAIVAAVTTRSVIKKINDFSKQWIKGANDLKRDHILELQANIPEPWEGFFEDAYHRVFTEGEVFEDYKNSAETKKRYGDIYGKVKPLFVSRAPSRKVKGPAHAETVYSFKGETDKGLKLLASRKGVSGFKKANEDKFHLYKDDPMYLELVSSLETKELEKVEKGELDLSKDSIGKSRIYSTLEPTVSNSSKRIPRGNHEAYVESGQSMVRVDVFRKDGKHYLVPIYVYDTIKPDLPDRAITAGKPRDEWTQIDDTFEFRFSLFKNDYIKFKRKADSLVEEGYYIGTHSSTGSVNFKLQDGSVHIDGKGKENSTINVGAKTVYYMEKYTVDPLGQLHKVKKEKRLKFRKN